ncbi:MAG: hypothetical protein A4E63_00536 [Syntrophorhabdus sp. PtaU1.Bin050]|nr:MAG: hypothetical protein A4E63_00536 [Syntrophorhabdus sp. PtaU1.Bin050]
MIHLFRHRELYIELRPRCPKCQKEFMLDLKKFLPGRAHSCHACGTVVQFDGQLAGKVQNIINDMETTIEEVYESFSSEKAG